MGSELQTMNGQNKRNRQTGMPFTDTFQVLANKYGNSLLKGEYPLSRLHSIVAINDDTIFIYEEKHKSDPGSCL